MLAPPMGNLLVDYHLEKHVTIGIDIKFQDNEKIGSQIVYGLKL